MRRIKTGQPWFDRLVPAGLPTHSATLISGPGGSGKPLIGNLITAAWLRQGGSAVFMALQYPSHEFIITALRKMTQLDVREHEERVSFIELDITRQDMARTGHNHFRANLVKPDIWDTTIDHACSSVPDQGPGVLVVGSALNLLLFSPTYGEAVLERMKTTIQHDRRYTFIFSVSTTAKAEEIAQLEEAADNLIKSRSTEQPFRLFMSVARVKDSDFISDEIEVPFSSELLEDVKEVADHSRTIVIPGIRKI